MNGDKTQIMAFALAMYSSKLSHNVTDGSDECFIRLFMLPNVPSASNVATLPEFHDLQLYLLTFARLSCMLNSHLCFQTLASSTIKTLTLVTG